MFRNELTLERLKEKLNYDSESGIFTWNVDHRNAKFDSVAGVNWNITHRKWQVRIQVNGKRISGGFYANKKEAIGARKLLSQQFNFK